MSNDCPSGGRVPTKAQMKSYADPPVPGRATSSSSSPSQLQLCNFAAIRHPKYQRHPFLWPVQVLRLARRGSYEVAIFGENGTHIVKDYRLQPIEEVEAMLPNLATIKMKRRRTKSNLQWELSIQAYLKETDWKIKTNTYVQIEPLQLPPATTSSNICSSMEMEVDDEDEAQIGQKDIDSYSNDDHVRVDTDTVVLQQESPTRRRSESAQDTLQVKISNNVAKSKTRNRKRLYARRIRRQRSRLQFCKLCKVELKSESLAAHLVGDKHQRRKHCETWIPSRERERDLPMSIMTPTTTTLLTSAAPPPPPSPEVEEAQCTTVEEAQGFQPVQEQVRQVLNLDASQEVTPEQDEEDTGIFPSNDYSSSNPSELLVLGQDVVGETNRQQRRDLEVQAALDELQLAFNWLLPQGQVEVDTAAEELNNSNLPLPSLSRCDANSVLDEPEAGSGDMAEPAELLPPAAELFQGAPNSGSSNGILVDQDPAESSEEVDMAAAAVQVKSSAASGIEIVQQGQIQNTKDSATQVQTTQCLFKDQRRAKRESKIAIPDKYIVSVDGGSYFCKMCQVTIITRTSVLYHLCGRKHRYNQNQEVKEIQKDHETSTAMGFSHVNLNHQVNPVEQGEARKDFATPELQKQNTKDESIMPKLNEPKSNVTDKYIAGSGGLYFCSLCRVKMTCRSSMICHMEGKPHKKRLMQNWPAEGSSLPSKENGPGGVIATDILPCGSETKAATFTVSSTAVPVPPHTPLDSVRSATSIQHLYGNQRPAHPPFHGRPTLAFPAPNLHRPRRAPYLPPVCRPDTSLLSHPSATSTWNLFAADAFHAGPPIPLIHPTLTLEPVYPNHASVFAPAAPAMSDPQWSATIYSTGTRTAASQLVPVFDDFSARAAELAGLLVFTVGGQWHTP